MPSTILEVSLLFGFLSMISKDYLSYHFLSHEFSRFSDFNLVAQRLPAALLLVSEVRVVAAACVK